jgi:hypothetical protein
VQESTAASPVSISASTTEAQPKTGARLIAIAVSLIGAENKVKEQMRCSDADFLLYCSGEKEVPFPELDRLISLIIHEQGMLIAKNRQISAELRAKRNGSRT